MISEIQLRQPDREALANAVAAHLAGGGRIQQLSHTERAPHRAISYNNRTDRKNKGRREFEEEERKLAEHAKSLADIGLTSAQAMCQMRKRWDGRAVITGPRLEQIAAKYGFAFDCDAREVVMPVDDLVEELLSHRDSLRRLQSAEPTWRREDRPRGLRTIERVRNRIAAIEAELKMAKGR